MYLTKTTFAITPRPFILATFNQQDRVLCQILLAPSRGLEVHRHSQQSLLVGNRFSLPTNRDNVGCVLASRFASYARGAAKTHPTCREARVKNRVGHERSLFAVLRSTTSAVIRALMSARALVALILQRSSSTLKQQIVTARDQPWF